MRWLPLCLALVLAASACTFELKQAKPSTEERDPCTLLPDEVLLDSRYGINETCDITEEEGLCCSYLLCGCFWKFCRFDKGGWIHKDLRCEEGWYPDAYDANGVDAGTSGG